MNRLYQLDHQLFSTGSKIVIKKQQFRIVGEGKPLSNGAPTLIISLEKLGFKHISAREIRDEIKLSGLKELGRKTKGGYSFFTDVIAKIETTDDLGYRISRLEKEHKKESRDEKGYKQKNSLRLKLKNSGESVELVDKPFAGGGEGNLYKIKSPRHWKNYVAKLYHPHKLSKTREQKIHFLAKYSPVAVDENEYNHPSVIWVKDALYNERDEFVGFVMPFIRGEKLEILCTPKIPRKLIRYWQRFDFKKSPNALELRMKLSFNICAAIHQIHDAKRYVLVDMKPDNIVIQPNGLVSIVDTDSVEVVKDGKSIYDAPVATPEYTPPEYYQKLDIDPTTQQEWDCFGLGVILYKLLFGIHPFAASSKPPYDHLVSLHDKIKEGLFVHHSDRKTSFRIIPPPHLKFYDLSPSLQNLFIRCFVDGHHNPSLRPTAEEWCATFLYVMDDEAAMKRYGHILGLSVNNQVRRTHFTLPSSRIGIPEYNSTATKMIEVAQQIKIPRFKVRPVSKTSMYDFKVKPLSLTNIIVGSVTLLGLGAGLGYIIPIIVFCIMNYLQYQQEKLVIKRKDIESKHYFLKNSYEKERAKLYKVHGSYKSAVRNVVKKLSNVTSKIKEETKMLKDFIASKDIAVQQIQKEADKEHHHLNQKYLELALNDRYVARVGDKNKHDSISKIRLAINEQYQLDLKQISGDLEVDESHPLFKENKIAVDKIIESSKMKIEDLTNEKIQAIKETPDEEHKKIKESLEYAADIQSHLHRLWKERWYISTNEKKRIKSQLQKSGLHSVLQISKIDMEDKEIILHSGKKLDFNKTMGSNTTTAKGLLYWFDEMKHLQTAYDKKVMQYENKLRIKIKVVEDEKRIEIRNLKQFEREELEKVKIGIQKVVLGEPFVNMQQQYETMYSHIEELEMAHVEEEERTVSSYAADYERIIEEVELKVKNTKEVIAELEKELKKFDKKLTHPSIKNKYAEVEIQLEKVKRLLPKLEQRRWELKRYENINFVNYVKKLIKK